MDIPYAIVQCKARLGKLAHKKTATCVALNDFTHSQAELTNIARNCHDKFNKSTTSWRSKIVFLIV
jgi:ribosomal protein L7Ae-like RNA K-turn-binding protein